MDVKQYLDSTYLKTAEQANLSEIEDIKVVSFFVQEAINHHFKLIMIRPKHVALAKKMITEAASKVLVGTVISFPEGTNTLEEKLAEAEKAIQDGVDELDFVCNYLAFKNGNITLVREEVLKCTLFGLSHHKTVKWIIEVAALTNQEIIQLSALIKNVVLSNCKEDQYASVFVKSSTGFYKTDNDKPNGATIPSIIMMLENSSPLPIKAAGGVRSYEEALEMIQLGVKRIGTSSALAIISGQKNQNGY